jgi:phosphoglycolate phosphatase
MGVPHPDHAALRACVGPPLRETLPRLIGNADTRRRNAQSRSIAERSRNWAGARMPSTPAFPTCWQRATQAGARGSCALPSRSATPRKSWRISGWPRFLTGVYGTTSTERSDDKADLLTHLLARENLDGARCLMVGDRKHDIRAARRNEHPVDRRTMGLRLAG